MYRTKRDRSVLLAIRGLSAFVLGGGIIFLLTNLLLADMPLLGAVLAPATPRSLGPASPQPL